MSRNCSEHGRNSSVPVTILHCAGLYVIAINYAISTYSSRVYGIIIRKRLETFFLDVLFIRARKNFSGGSEVLK